MALAIILTAGMLFGQQAPTGMTPEQIEAAKAKAALPSVKTPLGELQIDGRVAVGALGAFYHQYDKDYSVLAGNNAQLGETRAELSFHLKNGNFGEFIMFRASTSKPNLAFLDGSYTPNNNRTILKYQGDNKGAGFYPSVPYFFAYGNFFDNKFKLSVGKLYDENFVTRERIWKTEGDTNGGFYFSRDGYLSMRFQFMPVQGLDVGGQLFFVNSNARYGMFAMGLEKTEPYNASIGESLKEWGFGASYTSALFNTQAGVRLDGGVDPMNKYESRTYLPEYYGDSDNVDLDSTYGSVNPVLPHYKHWDRLSDVTYSGTGVTTTPKSFSDGTYAFFGFNIKAVKNLTLKVQGQINNIPAFEEFGYGVFDETIGYRIIPKLYAGIVLFQEFYGNDVFDDTKYVNSPYFRFQPVVSYQLTPKIKATLETTVGFCQDVLETPYFDIKPQFDFALAAGGAFRAQIYYLYERADYANYNGVDHNKEDYHKHEIGLGVDFMF
jgi:hypothetical protein